MPQLDLPPALHQIEAVVLLRNVGDAVRSLWWDPAVQEAG